MARPPAIVLAKLTAVADHATTRASAQFHPHRPTALVAKGV